MLGAFDNSRAQTASFEKKEDYINAKISKPGVTLNGIKPRAKWIWEQDNQNPLDYHLMIRKEIELKNAPAKVTAFISAYSFADIYINGALLDRCPVNCDPEYQVYEIYDLTRYFRKGKNVIAAMAYNYGVGMHHRINARGGFFFQAKIEYETGGLAEILTDNTWKALHASAWQKSDKMRAGIGEGRPNLIGFNEKFNAALMPENWNSAGFNDKDWPAAEEIGIPPTAPWNSIVVIERPVLRREKVFPVKMWKEGDVCVYDFGKEITASPAFEIESDAEGVNVEIATGERLNSDSTVNSLKRINYTDLYITKTGGQNWSPATWRGFRYFSIKSGGGVKIKNVYAETRNYDLRNEGNFECSDSLLNAIWQTGKNTIRLCSQDTYMDTPWREQTQYIAGDSRYVQKYAFYAFGGSADFLAKYNILCGAQSQRWSAEGAIRSRYPTDWLLGPGSSAYLPDYELEWIIMLGENYLYYGDKGLIERAYPNMKKLLKYMEGFVSPEHGLIKNAPGWIALDHPRNYPMDLKEEITALNCLYYEALKQAAALAGTVLRREDDSKKWEQQAAQLKRNIQKWLWSDEKKLFRDSYGSQKFSRQTQVYALLYGLAEDSVKDSMAGYITEKGKSSEQSFAYYVLYSVFNKKPDWAIDYIRQNWGTQMKSPYFNGAWHEAWDIASWKGDVGSASHAWSSGPTALLPQKILGAEPVEAGWKSFVIKPNTAGLTWARGTIPAPVGNINISWVKTGSEFKIDITVPRDVKAFLCLALNDKREIEIIGEKGENLTRNYTVEKKQGYINLTLGGGKRSVICR